MYQPVTLLYTSPVNILNVIKDLCESQQHPCMGFQQLGITSLLISCSSKNADTRTFELKACYEPKFKHYRVQSFWEARCLFIYALKFSLYRFVPQLSGRYLFWPLVQKSCIKFSSTMLTSISLDSTMPNKLHVYSVK